MEKGLAKDAEIFVLLGNVLHLILSLIEKMYNRFSCQKRVVNGDEGARWEVFEIKRPKSFRCNGLISQQEPAGASTAVRQVRLLPGEPAQARQELPRVEIHPKRHGFPRQSHLGFFLFVIRQSSPSSFPQLVRLTM